MGLQLRGLRRRSPTSAMDADRHGLTQLLQICRPEWTRLELHNAVEKCVRRGELPRGAWRLEGTWALPRECIALLGRSL